MCPAFPQFSPVTEDLPWEVDLVDNDILGILLVSKDEYLKCVLNCEIIPSGVSGSLVLSI